MAEVTVYTPTGGKFRVSKKNADMVSSGTNVVR